MKERIGVYICHCGTNIAGKVRVKEVRDYVSTLKDVVVAKDYLFMCSDPGQEMIEKDIPEFGLTRVVVASCSPRMHEITFRGAVKRGGLNPYRAFQMICIREHCSWVTVDEDEATEKAKELIRGAVNRVRFHRPLQTKEYPVNPNVLIVGGGIAGMQAALDIAKGGYKVYLVERQPTIGGHMLQFDKTFPTLDCASCIGTPKMVSVGQNTNIELLTYSEVTEVSGFIGNYRVKVRKKPRYVSTEKCTGCGECVKACPVTRKSEWDEGMATRKAIYRSFPQAVPITFVIEKKDRAPCMQTCPAGTNVQGYVALIKEGRYKEAIELIMKDIPLPGTIGRICPAPCEKECRRKEVDEPISIRALKRFAADHVDWSSLDLPEIKRRGEKVAIIGSGPAGLTASYYLTLKGYRVTVFEALPVPGGMLRVGIPDYRLPKDVLQKEINHIIKLGVEIRLNSRAGRDFTVEKLFEEGYRAVFLATGTHRAYRLNIQGEDAEGVLFGVDFLREINLGKEVRVGKKVIVIGGGNVAIDVARSAKRKGAEEVDIFCLEKRNEMPAWERDISEALDEGIHIHNSWGPNRIITEGNRAVAVEFKLCTSVFDERGRFSPKYDESINDIHGADTIIVAIGQGPDLSGIEGIEGLQITHRGTVEVDPVTLATQRPGVFAGGDLCTGTALAIDAVAAGKEAAISIDRYLRGESLTEGRGKSRKGTDWSEIPPDLKKEPRISSPEIPVSERIDFREVELQLMEDNARKEASRCLSCGVCSECLSCEKECKANAIIHDMKEEVVEIEVGSIIVATGYDLMDPTPMKQFGYGRYPNVFTSLEFERLNNATGPTSGKILMRDESNNFTKPPESVAILHCIGSRDHNYHEYCSRVCCMYALKFAHLIKDKVGEHCAVYNFYIDMRCFGKGYEEFFQRVQDEGVKMIRGKAARVTDEALDEAEKGKLIVIAEDTLSGKLMRVPVDMVILCSAIEKRADAEQVARIFGISTGRDGFFLEEHPKLEPVSTATSGVFIAGACQGPKDIPDTVAQAKGAASEAMALSSRGRVEVSPMISEIDPYICIGCQVCRELCAYSAIEFDERRGISVVNEAVCKGCGSCSAYCPSGAAKVKHFTDKQIFAEIDGILEGIRFGEAA
jgi:heterodisulfide reductase subunit A